MESITLRASGQSTPAQSPAEQIVSLRTDVALYKGLSAIFGISAVGLGVYALVQQAMSTQRETLARGEAYREVLTGQAPARGRGRAAHPGYPVQPRYPPQQYYPGY